MSLSAARRAGGSAAAAREDASGLAGAAAGAGPGRGRPGLGALRRLGGSGREPGGLPVPGHGAAAAQPLPRAAAGAAAAREGAGDAAGAAGAGPVPPGAGPGRGAGPLRAAGVPCSVCVRSRRAGRASDECGLSPCPAVRALEEFIVRIVITLIPFVLEESTDRPDSVVLG